MKRICRECGKQLDETNCLKEYNDPTICVDCLIELEERMWVDMNEELMERKFF